MIINSSFSYFTTIKSAHHSRMDKRFVRMMYPYLKIRQHVESFSDLDIFALFDFFTHLLVCNHKPNRFLVILSF